MTAAVPRMGKGGKVVLFVVMVVVVVVVVVIVVVVKVERRMGSRQVESSGRSGSRGSFFTIRGSYKWRFELLFKMCFCESSNKKK